jgi:hypothetical protein
MKKHKILIIGTPENLKLFDDKEIRDLIAKRCNLVWVNSDGTPMI